MIDPAFEFHTLNDEGKLKAKAIAEVFSNLLNDLNKVCPPNREFSITKTKLEEACFFAKKSMAVSPSNQQ
jgi:hypothetical protein